ncbi:MAG: hypothetical protein ISS26_07380 [Candidatus Omnitrophica bacterium]|nr:hypothetical protein [Candidatus Omnitrophota bacterium]
MKKILCFFITLAVIFICARADAAPKTWGGAGDASLWADPDNWTPSTIPTSADTVLIDTPDASVTCDRTFKAKTITIGGDESSTLRSDDFIYGTVEPDVSSAIAVLNRPGGHIILTGAGTLTLKGQYKDSEAALEDEPSFIFWIE